MKPIIPFLKFRGLSFVNQNIETILKNHFPEAEVKTFDIYDLLKSRKTSYAKALINGFRFNSGDILLRRKSWRECLLYNPEGFEQMKQVIWETLAPLDILFTFQTQSFFNGHVGKPHFLYTDHTHLCNLDNPYYNPKRLWSKAWVAKEKEIYSEATINFTYSGNIARSISKTYKVHRSRVQVVYVGCNVRPTDGDVKFDVERYAAQKIVFIGVDWERKGGPALLRAFEKIKPSFPEATLKIIGCSPKIQSPGVEVIGKIPITQISKHLKESSIFCLPTRAEPFGIAITEAMLFGLPVVATKIEAIPEILNYGEAGLLVEPSGEEDLEKALTKLLSDPYFAQSIGKKAHLRASQNYSWENTGKLMAAEIKTKLK